MINLQAAGLTETEAKAYAALLTKPDWQPSALAKNVQETRTNMYKILDRLVELQLAERYDKAKKLHYRAVNPARLLELAHELREAQVQAEKELELGIQSLTREFIKTNEQPGVRYFQGEKEIGQIFHEIAESSDEVVFVHTTAGADFYGFKVMHNLRMLAPNAGVKRRALTPDSHVGPRDYRQTDPLVLLERTWLKHGDYTAPVEWGAFDDKLYLISYGQEALGIVIESAQIAHAFKQLFELLERGQKAQSWYKHMPLLASGSGVTAPHLE